MRNRLSGTMMCWKPVLAHMEQLQSETVTARGVLTSNRTAPQWQPPERHIRSSDPLTGPAPATTVRT